VDRRGRFARIGLDLPVCAQQAWRIIHRPKQLFGGQIMRVRDKVDGGTFVAQLDLRRIGTGHSDFVLVLQDKIEAGHSNTMGRVAASVGCELIEATPEELAALLLAGFQLPRHCHHQHQLPRLASVLQAVRRKQPSFRQARPTAPQPELHAVARKPGSADRSPRRHSAGIAARSPKNAFPTSKSSRHGGASVSKAAHKLVKK
jgi:hypothetical protein